MVKKRELALGRFLGGDWSLVDFQAQLPHDGSSDAPTRQFLDDLMGFERIGDLPLIPEKR